MKHPVRLVASDIDGTLLAHGETAVSPAIFRQIRRLHEKGILFCPASGRQYSSLRRLFAPVIEECCFLCENGAIVYGSGDNAPILSKTAMPRALAEELCDEIQSARGCDVMISGADTTYICTDDRELADHIRFFVGNNLSVVASPRDVPEDIIKVSAYCRQGAAVYEREISPKWKELFSAAVAGLPWLDFTLADKATGLSALCRSLRIPTEQVMAFGDNFNDVPMLDLVGHPYLMESAHSALKARYRNRCTSVEDILKTL